MSSSRERKIVRRPVADRTVSIVGTGSYVPKRVLRNAELEKMVDTTDEWIFTRSGIRERHIAEPGQATSDMAAEAARSALDNAGVVAADLDLIIVGTVTPDMPFPNTACFVQSKIGARKAACFDVEAACSGFLYGLDIARRFIATHGTETALVIGADKLSCVTDWQDRSTCVLFGDGAGAAVLKARGDENGIIDTVMGSDGTLADLLKLPGGGSLHPTTTQTIDERLHYIKMAGREVFKHAVRAMADAAVEVLRRNGLTVNDVDLVIPHQANIRIIEAIAQRLEVPMDKVYVNLEKYGNVSAASIPIALDEAARSGHLRKHDLVLMVVFGGGLTWGASLLEW